MVHGSGHERGGKSPSRTVPRFWKPLRRFGRSARAFFVAGKRDRIARDVVVAATVERLAQDVGARVVTRDGLSADDTPEGVLMRTLMYAFAS